jgi:predicted GNAT superfamily acetyltransferase
VTLTTRDIDATDIVPLVTMNNRAIPAVNLLDENDLLDLVSMAHSAVIVVDDESPDRPLGLVVTLAAGNDYESENYRWFEERGGDFLYVDRIVVAEGMRGRGLGQILYERVFAEAELAGLAEVTCEVNLDPPNPGSLAFHDRLGFVQLGEQVTKGGSVRVAFPASALPEPS